MLKVANVNANGKAFHASALSVCVQYIRLLGNDTELLNKSTPQIVGIPFGLHSGDIVIHYRAENICAPWKNSEEPQELAKEYDESTRSDWRYRELSTPLLEGLDDNHAPI